MNRVELCINFRVFDTIGGQRIQHGDNPEHSMLIGPIRMRSGGALMSVVEWHRRIVAAYGDAECCESAATVAAGEEDARQRLDPPTP